jgi:RHS repeat-associated protein
LVDGSGEQLFSYDQRGRVTTDRHRILSLNYDLKHEYDSMDRETCTYYPDSSLERVKRSYNVQGLLASVASVGPPLNTCTGSVTQSYWSASIYNVAGLPTWTTHGNNTTVFKDYDANTLRLQSIRVAGASPSSIFWRTFTYDLRGNVNVANDVWPVNNPGVPSGSITYGYDHLDRLTSANGQGQNLSYTYDSVSYPGLGNLTTKGDVPSYSAMQYGAGAAGPHALTSATEYGGVQHTYSYDGAGNMMEETAGAGFRHRFTYNGDGLVKTRETAGSPTINYVYDANGKLVRKYSNDQQGTIYIGDAWEKKLDTPSEVTKYYYANGQRIAMRKQPSGGSDILNFLVNDHLGGTALVLTSSNPATEVARLRYYPFGGPRLTSGTVPTDKRFTGQQLETTSGNIYHYGARMYNADIGRFISADTIVPEPGNPQSLNRYSYVLNNPMRYNDPTGHKWDDGGGGCTQHTCDEELGWDEPAPSQPVSLPPCTCPGPPKPPDPNIPLVVGGLAIGIALADGPLPIGDVIAVGIISTYAGYRAGDALCSLICTMFSEDDESSEEEPLTTDEAGPSPGMIEQFGKQLKDHGAVSLEKSRATLEKRLDEHREKLERYIGEGGYTSSVETEIRNFERQIEAIDHVLGR